LTTLEAVRRRAESDARTYGYYLNPDPEFLADLIEGLKTNEDRYGYPSCPCRLATGVFELDRDIICPCDYRDPDVLEYGWCYCSLFVRKDVVEEKKIIYQIPERRPPEKTALAHSQAPQKMEKPVELVPVLTAIPLRTKLKMWYCKQCGYVCFREEPPYICPICKAKKEMFEGIRATIYLGA
jgi:ferredoxin-thioredoxin reductase catalytic subunit